MQHSFILSVPPRIKLMEQIKMWSQDLFHFPGEFLNASQAHALTFYG